MEKKLQVFISSTYEDLLNERNAAIYGVLDAGHIPAGMELFKAGNRTPLETIYKWIDASDVYMLILSDRYGSTEPTSGKSYIQLEYEYAISKNIPVFAVILSESFLRKKNFRKSKTNNTKNTQILEYQEKQQYKEFKEAVMSKIIREVNDIKDIKIAIHSTLREFIDGYDFIGWVRGDTVKIKEH